MALTVVGLNLMECDFREKLSFQFMGIITEVLQFLDNVIISREKVFSNYT